VREVSKKEKKESGKKMATFPLQLSKGKDPGKGIVDVEVRKPKHQLFAKPLKDDPLAVRA